VVLLLVLREINTVMIIVHLRLIWRFHEITDGPTDTGKLLNVGLYGHAGTEEVLL
jgi:hypothetical protein